MATASGTQFSIEKVICLNKQSYVELFVFIDNDKEMERKT
jgi:hypothetical protein